VTQWMSLKTRRRRQHQPGLLLRNHLSQERSPRLDAMSLLQLYRAIFQSRDKLSFFAHQPDGQTTETWYLVQVNLDKTDPLAAKELGRYWVHWMIRHHVNCLSKQIRLCRFWPEVHERTTNRSNPTDGSHLSDQATKRQS
jgi:hypothetical protein